jgi:MoaA/NifB/PqqE/SkfB family radical SAM enzyme
MCPIHHVGIEKTHIDYDIFKKIIDNLGYAEEVALVGLGEPLTHPRIFDAIKYGKSKGLVVKITSNGMLLKHDEIIKQLISSGLDSISFSIDSLNHKGIDKVAHRDNRVLRYIERLIELKEVLGSETPKIAIQTVLFKNRENDLYDIIKWGVQHNLHRINVLRMHMFFDINLERPDRKEENRVFKELAKLRKKYTVRIDCIQDQFFTGAKGFLYKYFKYFLRLDSCCTRLLDFPIISQNGDMLPCCVLPDYKFGNILEEKIANVWHGEKFSNFRKNHNKVELCSKCDCWRIKQVL